MLVGRDLSPLPSTTPESHNPAVVTGLYADCDLPVLALLGDAGEGGLNSLTGSTIWTAVGVAVGVLGVSGRASSLIRNNSILRFDCRSSSVSATGWSSSARPNRLRVLPVRDLSSAVPVELERRDRVFGKGEEEGEPLLNVGEESEEAKEALLCNFWVPVRKSRGMLLRFSSDTEAGDAERGESTKDMETVRVGPGGRALHDVANGDGHDGFLDAV
jgi:hypothetical protein